MRELLLINSERVRFTCIYDHSISSIFLFPSDPFPCFKIHYYDYTIKDYV